METHQPKIVSNHIVATSKFLELSSIEWQDAQGATRHWDCASRTGGHGRAVMRSLVLVRQFRPPAGKFCLEFPAGLVEPGEDFTVAALRELSEETGYDGKVVGTLPYGFSTAGLTDETIAGVIVEIDSAHYRDCPPQAHPEASEDIEVLAVSEARLLDFLRERLANGDGADAKLLTFAYAMTAKA